MRTGLLALLAALIAGSAQAQLVTAYPKCPYRETGSLMVVRVDGRNAGNPGECVNIVVTGTVVQVIRGRMPKDKRLSFPMQTYCPPVAGISDDVATGRPIPNDGELVVVGWTKGSPEKDGRFESFQSYAQITTACDIGLKPEDVLSAASPQRDSY
jgi:hypothetical protein